MKLHTEKNHIVKSDHLVSKAFTIKATAKAFDILSSKLYSDKPLAIVRELSCNAWDAHVAAGRTDVKFEIKLPTSLDPTFHVKDYGIGLSHEDVVNLYTTYFDSTKDQSDAFIGALGLGSKSPFSYVDTFSVESRHKGMRRLYSAFKGEDNLPQITLIGEQKTDESDGMTISLATKQGDADKFRTAARKALMYFDPAPKVAGGGPGFTAFALKHTVEGTNWRVRETEYYANMEGAYVVQGFVSYPIDRDILRQADIEDIAYKILDLDIDFYVPLGAVEFAASREALSYTKETIKNLSKAVEIAATEMRASIQKEFDSCKTLWEARLMYARYDHSDHKMNDLFNEFDRHQSFTYKGKKIDDSFNLDLEKIKDTMLQMVHMSAYGSRKAKRSGSWDPTSTHKMFSVNVRSNTVIIVDDTRKFGQVATQYMTDEKAKLDQAKAADRNVYALVIKNVAKGAPDQREVNQLIKHLGDPQVILTSSLPYKIVKTATTYRARKNDEALKWEGYPKNGGYRRNQIRRVYSRLCWSGEKVDLYDKNTERLYVMIDRFTILKNKIDYDAFDTLVEAAQGVGILKDNVEIFGLTEKQVGLIKNNKAWKDVFSYCEEKLVEKNKALELSDRVSLDQIAYSIGTGIMLNVVSEWSNLRDTVVDGKFKDTIDEIYAMKHNATSSYKLDAIRAALSKIDNKMLAAAETKARTTLTMFNDTMEKHAMLKLVDWSKMRSKDVSMIIDYVNFVAKG